MTLPGSVKRSSDHLLTAFLHAPDAIPPKAWERPTALYRFFDAQGEILYLGITKRLHRRMTEHARDYAETWWPLVAARSVEWHQTRSEAGRAEREAIKKEKPPHNVLHTPRARVPLAERPQRDYGTRGAPLLEAARTHFHLAPFSPADVVGACRCSKSTAEKWIHALTARGDLVRVGTRHLVSKDKGVPIRDHSLYALPESLAAQAQHPVQQWIDVSGHALPHGRRPGGPKEKRRRRPDSASKWDRAYPQGREMALFQLAQTSFGTQPFTYAELAKADGTEAQSIAKYIRRLRQSGAFKPVGPGDRTGSRGFAAARYVVDYAHPAKSTSSSRMILRTGVRGER